MTLRKQIRRAWNSLSCAHAGEMLTPRQKGRLLRAEGIQEQHAAHAPRSAHNQTVALHVGDLLTTRMVDYAVETCQRLNADLLLLAHGNSEVRNDALEKSAHRISATGIHPRIVKLTGEWKQAVSRYIRTHHEIIFLVLSAQDSNSQSLLGHGGTYRRHAFPVPLVMVDDNVSPTLSAA